MKLTVLGSSSALPTSERNPSAHVLEVHERLYLIDCGEGTQLQIRKCRLKLGKINHIFITHIHGDHVFGLYGLLSTFSLMGRTIPIYIYAPEGYKGMLESHLNDFDIKLNFEIRFKGLKSSKPELIHDDKHLTVTAFPLKHRVPSFGFLFREKRADRKIRREMIALHNIPLAQMRPIKKGADLIKEDGTVIKNEDITIPPPEPLSYAYCSDTKFFKQLPSYVRGVNLLYHEATFGRDNSGLAKSTLHSTTLDAAKVALEAKAGTLMIGHFSSRYRDVNQLVEEARTLFPSTIAAEDGKSYTITGNKLV